MDDRETDLDDLDFLVLENTYYMVENALIIPEEAFSILASNIRNIHKCIGPFIAVALYIRHIEILSKEND